MRLRILREAEEDIVEAARWYESISVELAVRFLNEIGDGLASIERHPERYSAPPNSEGRSNVRRYRLKSFKYMIVYEVLPDSLLAIGIVQSNRHPRHWKKRTSG